MLFLLSFLKFLVIIKKITKFIILHIKTNKQTTTKTQLNSHTSLSKPWVTDTSLQSVVGIPMTQLCSLCHILWSMYESRKNYFLSQTQILTTKPTYLWMTSVSLELTCKHTDSEVIHHPASSGDKSYSSCPRGPGDPLQQNKPSAPSTLRDKPLAKPRLPRAPCHELREGILLPSPWPHR